MKLKIKRLSANAVIPTRAKIGDAGFDLTAVSMNIVNNKGHGYIEYGFDLALEVEPGYCALILPRSSISKTGLWLANGVGLIDSKYQ